MVVGVPNETPGRNPDRGVSGASAGWLRPRRIEGFSGARRPLPERDGPDNHRHRSGACKTSGVRHVNLSRPPTDPRNAPALTGARLQAREVNKERVMTRQISRLAILAAGLLLVPRAVQAQ